MSDVHIRNPYYPYPNTTGPSVNCQLLVLDEAGPIEAVRFQRPLGTSLKGVIWDSRTRQLAHRHHADMSLTLLRTGGLW